MRTLFSRRHSVLISGIYSSKKQAQPRRSGLPAIVLFVQDKKIERAASHAARVTNEKPKFESAFIILLVAQLIALTANSMGVMGRSFSMNTLGFAATAIMSTQIISGVVSLPFPFVLGWLSDRLGRKRMMIVCYASYALGMASINVGVTFASDLVDPKALGRGVALFQCMGWIALSGGAVVAGNAFQRLGLTTASYVSTVLQVIGIIFIMSIRRIRIKKEEPLAKELPIA